MFCLFPSSSHQVKTTPKQFSKRSTPARQNAPVNVTINNVPAAPLAGAGAKAKGPDYTFADHFRALENILGNKSSLVLYCVKSYSILGRQIIPMIVRTTPFPSRVDHTVYEFYVRPLRLSSFTQPGFQVEITRYSSSQINFNTICNIEYQLVFECFQRGCNVDYVDLVNNVFPLCARGVSNELMSTHDVMFKCEALATLWVYLHPPSEINLGGTLRSILTYRPRPPGWYALGDPKAPGPSDHGLKIKWKDERPVRKQHFVARCLIPQYRHFHCRYIPARTRYNLEVGFTKRLTRPPRISHNIGGVEWDLANTRQLMVTTVDWMYKNYFKVNADLYKSLTPVEVLEECRRKAHDRFSDPQQQIAYIEGARIALFEAVSSPLFQAVLVLMTDVENFVKGEDYQEPKPPRYIMAPTCKVRGFMHALLYNIQHRLFNQNLHCVKGANEDTRRDMISAAFGTRAVCNTDWSSMEGSVSKFHMDDIERRMFTLLSRSRDEEEKVNAVWDRLTKFDYHIHCDEYSFTMKPMRLSGTEHTSSGNYLCNSVWIHAMIFMATHQYPDPNNFIWFCEGDDGLYTKAIPLENGQVVNIEPAMMTECAECLGGKLKINVFTTIDSASFCGIELAPAIVSGRNVEELRQETDKILSKVLWGIDYDPGTTLHDTALVCPLLILPCTQQGQSNTLPVFVVSCSNESAYSYYSETTLVPGRLVQDLLQR